MFQIKDELYWVGIKDWGLKSFHGNHFLTPRGATYNSYLIKDEKIALVDAVFEPFADDFVEKLEREVGLNNIDYIVCNHSETDHSGSLYRLMERIPDTPIYCTAKGVNIIKAQHHKDWNFVTVKTGDTLNLGKNTLTFIEAPMLHWPDTMMTYVSGMNVLLSNDAFGQHYATSEYFNDEVDQFALYDEALKYYANILTPFGRLIPAKIKQLLDLNVPIDMIAPSHGLIWRDNPMQIVDQYLEWAKGYNDGSILILFDTMWGNTEKMAQAIAEGVAKAGVSYKVITADKLPHSDIVTEAFKAKGILMGSSTINNTMLGEIISLINEFKGMRFTGKHAAAFGSYGWSGEAPKLADQMLKDAKFKVEIEPLKVLFTPNEEQLEQCHKFGYDFAMSIK